MVTKEKQIIGIVQEKTESSVKINNLWIKFFDSDLLENINVGKDVEVTYNDNEKNGKVYHNGKSIKIKVLTSEPLLPKLKSDSTVNTLLMQSVTYAKDKNITLDEATTKIINSYKRIITEI